MMVIQPVLCTPRVMSDELVKDENSFQHFRNFLHLEFVLPLARIISRRVVYSFL